MCVDVGNRFSTIFDTFEEILHVAGDWLVLVKLGDCFFQLFVVGFGQLLYCFAGELSAVDEDSSATAIE